MRKLASSLIAFSVFAVLAAAPLQLALAQGLVPCSGADCTACDIVKLANNVIDFLITVFSSVAALLFAYAGFLYITAGGDSGKIGKAHSIFWNTVIGLVIILAAWLIVDMIMRALVTDSFLAAPWSEILCEFPPDTRTSGR